MSNTKNQIIEQFRFIPRLNTHMNLNFENNKFRPTKLALEVYVNIF